MPVLTVVAGPNGSGKSTITRRLQIEGLENLLDPDAVAKRMDPLNPQRAAVGAGREVIIRTREFLNNRQSFVIETTLSSGSTMKTIREAQERGFAVRLVYICLNDAERNIERVHERVALGGHDVPEVDVRRRYARSLLHLTPVLQVVDQAMLFENSGPQPRKVLEVRNGVIIWRADNEPEWVTRVCETLLTPGSNTI